MILAIDTSTQMIGLALFDGAVVIAETAWRSSSHHTVELAPAVKQILERSSVKAENLTCLAVALGPGSFTSLRIGLALTKGLALALHLPLVGVPTLNFLAHAQPLLDLPMAAVLSAGRSRLAVGWYRVSHGKWQPDAEPTLLTAEELEHQIQKPTYICGELDQKNRQILARKYRNVTLAPPSLCIRRPAVLAELAWERWRDNMIDNPALLAPIYLRTANGL